MSDQHPVANDRIEILGQVFCYPRTVWGAASVAIVVIGICFIFWIAAKNSQAFKDLGGFFVGRATTQTAKSDGRYLIQFWTPSVKTKEASDVADWEKVESDKKLDDFATELIRDSGERISGYRRYEVVGSGLSHRRAGVWWVVTADDDYQVTDFVKTYHRFWNNTASVYVEVLRGGAAGRHMN